MIESSIQESPSTVASHYDDLDLFYREIWGLHVHHGYWKSGKETSVEATVALVDHLISNLSIKPEFKVCDIGCGYGETARYLANKYRTQVTALSVSQKQLDFAKSFGMNSQVEFLHQDWMENQLDSDSYDLVLSIESSEHMPDIKKFFLEAYRVLKPGGTLKVCVWLSKTNPSAWELEHLLRPICTEGRLRLCDKTEYDLLIDQAGFRNHHYEEITDKVKKTWTLCLMRCFWKFLSDPKYILFLLQNPSKNKMFLLSLLRIRAAYENGSMVYGIFTAMK
jgi:tocopherol O-methyltransferase